MVVVVQAGLGQALCLPLVEHAQGHAGFQPQGFHLAHHVQHIGHVLGARAAPGGPHAEPRSAFFLGGARFFQHPFHLQQLLFLQLGVVVTGLGAVLAVFRAGAGLDRQQRAHLHRVGIEVLAVHGGGPEQQVVERQGEQGLDLTAVPIVAYGVRGGFGQGRGGGYSHDEISLNSPHQTSSAPAPVNFQQVTRLTNGYLLIYCGESTPTVCL